MIPKHRRTLPKHRADVSWLDVDLRGNAYALMVMSGLEPIYQPRHRADVPAEEVAVRA